MFNETADLVRSSFLKIKKDSDQYKIAHIISGKQFKVDRQTVEVLNFFKTPHKISELDCSTEFKSSIQYLVRGGLLVEAEQKLQETFQLQQSNVPVFGFLPYNPSASGQVVFTGVPFGGGNPISSASKRFPAYLRRFAQNLNLEFQPNAKVNYNCFGQSGNLHYLPELIAGSKIRDAGDIFIHHYEPRQQIFRKIKYLVSDIIAKDNIPFIIGGDHSISYPAIHAAAEKYGNLHILHFDAHTDTYGSGYEPILDESGIHHHGNFMSKCLELDEVTGVTQFGIRGINNAFIHEESPKQNIYWAQDLKESLWQGDLQIDLPADDYYYITFDIDVLDPAVAPGTATPLPNGLTYGEILRLFNTLNLHKKKIVGVDFVEVNPEKDIQEITASVSVQLIFNLLNFIKSQA